MRIISFITASLLVVGLHGSSDPDRHGLRAASHPHAGAGGAGGDLASSGGKSGSGGGSGGRSEVGPEPRGRVFPAFQLEGYPYSNSIEEVRLGFKFMEATALVQLWPSCREAPCHL